MPNSKKNKYSNTITFQIDCKEEDYLYVKDSQIKESGKGLYTAINIFKDEVISVFMQFLPIRIPKGAPKM